MLIKWVGHSCFHITTQDGIDIVTDPFDNTIGYKPVHEKADILLVTHDHFDHNYKEGITGDYTLIDQPGTYNVKGIDVLGIGTYHDDQQGALRGKNTAYLFVAEGIRMLHMGDIGVMPEQSFFDAVGGVDILMVPVGGTYTFNAKEALAFVNKLDPNITIPMHYKTPDLDMDIAGVNDFLTLAKKEYDRSRLGISTFEISVDNLKKRGRIVVMECANCN
ncbi:MAG: MBL fold metallo-hydrolase [Christensenellaceae bacterium]|jgi:L-ascorbate metabolism protein UlaG (beta-lactamase superfamily)